MSTASPSHKDVSDSAATETVTSFIESAVALAESLDAPQERVNDFEQSARDLAGLVGEVAEESAQAKERAREAEAKVEEVEDELAEERERSARERADVRADLHEVRESVEDGSEESDCDAAEIDETAPSVSETTPQAPETSLGQAILLPEHVAKENLTKNQQRVRDLVKNIHQYSTSVPAGHRLGASEMRRVLSAQEDGATIHGQTLARCRDFILRLGGDHVELKESRDGTTSIIFDSEFVRRVVSWSNYDDSHGAVTRGGVSG
jgi:hypothetical protein